MLSIPTIHIQQQYAKIGYSTVPGQQSIRQPRATLELSTTKPKLDIQSPKGELTIDQSRAWDALGVGGILGSMSRIYAQAERLGLEGIGSRVDKGNRLAAIHLGGNPIADIAQQEAFRFLDFKYYTEASFDNVDIEYRANKPTIRVEQGTTNLYARMNPPEIEYIRGNVEYYMVQHGNVKITPPQIDLKI